MKILSLVIAAALLTACGGGLWTNTTEPGPSVGRWVLSSATGNGEDLTIIDGHPITMTLDGERIVGNAGCNTYSGNYSLGSDGSIQMPGGFSVTEMWCEPREVIDTEVTYLAMLRAATHLEVEGTRLVLTGEGVELIYQLDENAGPPVPNSNNPDDPVTDEPVGS